MARSLRCQLVPLGLAWVALTTFAWGQPPEPPGPPPSPNEPGVREPGRRPQPRRDGGDRDRLRKNAEQWKKMSPEDREAMRQLHDRRRDSIRRDIEQAIEGSGLTLNEEQKKEFVRRYREERYQLEEQIRREIDSLRATRLKTIIEKLRVEFSGDSPEAEKEPDPASLPTPEASPAP